MEEIWKPLLYKDLDLSDKFEVSNTGKIRSLKSSKVLKTVINPSVGREQVVVSLGATGTYKAIKIHIAVAYNFIEGYEDGLVVNHKDGNKLNNCSWNLEWVTDQENQKHAFKNGLTKHTSVMCLETGKIYRSIREASEDVGCAHSTISRHLNGERKSATTQDGHTWAIVNNIEKLSDEQPPC